MKANKILSKVKGAQFYKIGDKVETIRADIGAWFSADIIDISPNSKCECEEDCICIYKLILEGDENDDILVVDRKLDEIRQVSYSSIEWDQLQVGMTVVINYNIQNPKQWGYWYDYMIEDLKKRGDVYHLKGTLLVGQKDNLKKIPVSINSDNVADVLEIRPHMTLREKEMEGYETGVKPEYCKKCKNKPKVKCRKCCCCKCGSKRDFEKTVQCDECADWYHIYCLKPPLEQLPNDEDWYCPKCNNETHRAKLQLNLDLKRKRKKTKEEKKCSKVPKKSQESPKKSPKPCSKPNKSNHEDVQVQRLSKEIPKNSKIWKEVEELFSDCEVVRVVAEVISKKKIEFISAEAEEWITQDLENQHLWEEAKQSIINGKKAFLDAVKRIFTCAICCDLLDDPITLSCKHSFCIDCFFRSLSVNVYNCPLCRVDVIHTQHYVVNENLKKALALLFNKKMSKKIDV